MFFLFFWQCVIIYLYWSLWQLMTSSGSARVQWIWCVTWNSVLCLFTAASDVYCCSRHCKACALSGTACKLKWLGGVLLLRMHHKAMQLVLGRLAGNKTEKSHFYPSFNSILFQFYFQFYNSTKPIASSSHAKKLEFYLFYNFGVAGELFLYRPVLELLVVSEIKENTLQMNSQQSSTFCDFA